MRAATFNSYGPPDVLKIEEVPQPTLEAEDEDRLLIKVDSASVNPGDYLIRSGYWPIRLTSGFLRPRTHMLGMDVAGTVEAVGNDVGRLKVGDRVFGNCAGGYVEYVRCREKYLCTMPANATFNEAAAVPTVALTALQALRDVAGIERGQKVLVYGASGGIGHTAVQLARYYGAEVTAVTSTSNIGWVGDLGAHEVIDYTREDFSARGEQYDIILDSVGGRTFFNVRSSLKKSGVYISEHILYPKYHAVQFMLGRLMGDRRAKAHLTRSNFEDLDLLRHLIEEERLRPVIETCYPLEQVVEAHRHVESRRTKGKVVIEVRKD